MKILAMTILCVIFLSYTSAAYAITISNDNYILQLYPENSSPSPIPTQAPSQPKTVTFGPFFGFMLSQDFVDFGILSPTNPVSRTVLLVIEPGSALGYTVSAYIDTLLTDERKKASIPNTHCDNGTCTHAIEGPWENILTYGFGFRCDNVSGFDCIEGFSNTVEQQYRQLPTVTSADIPQPFMIGLGNSKKEGRVTFKLNLSRSQDIGIYKNNITFIVAPKL